MDSLSRPFRRKKLPSFSAAYDRVFSGAQPSYATRIEDYKEIFGGSRSSSIPILDLSALDGAAAEVAGGRGRGKGVDYAKIFGGARDDVGGSYEEVFAQRTPAKKAPRPDRSTSPGGQKEEDNQCETPNQSVEGMKQYNTFYNRTSQGSKDGENGTTHVAHIRAVPGFTCFIDENIQKTEGDKFKPLPKDKMRPTSKVSLELDKKQAKDGTEGKLKSQSSLDKFYSLDRSVDANGSDLKKHTFKLSSPTRSPAGTFTETKRSREFEFVIPKSSASKTGPNDCSPSFSDDELDVGSVAAVSAAALRKAVREAEASIRLAKEIMERKKNGFEKLPKSRAKEGSVMKKKIVEKASIQPTKTEKVAPNLKETKEVRIAYEGVRETNDAKSNSHDDVQEHITKLERKKAKRSGKLSPNFIQSEQTCVGQNVCGKGTGDKLEASVDFEAPREFPEMLKTDNQGLEMKKKNVEKASIQATKTEKVAPNLKETKEVRIEHVGVQGTNDVESNSYDDEQEHIAKLERITAHESGNLSPDLIQSAENCATQSVCRKGNEDKLEASVDFKAAEQFPEMLKTDDLKTGTVELEHPKGSDIRMFVNDVSGKVNETLETSADSKAAGQFPDLVTAENQRNEVLEMGDTNGCNIMSSVHSSGKVNDNLFELSADSKPLGQFPELAKTENHRTACLNEHTKGNNAMPSVYNLCGEENMDKLEQSAESKSLDQVPESVKTDNQISATSELRLTNDSNIMPPAFSFSEKENKEILETFADSKKLPEPMKTDNQNTATLELGHTQGGNIRLSVPSFSGKVDEEMLETSADSEELGRFPELAETHDQRTAILDLEHKNGNNISSFVHDIPRTVNEDRFEQSAVPSALEQFHELVKTDNQRIATLELGDKCGSEIVPPVHHTNECGEMEKQTDEGTLELLERQSKEVHRKRKQWRDFEGKRSDIKIAEDEGQSLHNTIAQEVHGQEERTLEQLEGHNKEVHRKRRQWKDVEVKPCDIKIAGDEEKCIHGQENSEKAAGVLDNKDVEDKRKASSSEESYEKKVVNTHEREMIEGIESINVNATHGEELDEAQKWVGNGISKECFKEQEIAESLAGVHEEKDSVQHMCNNDEIEKKLQESSKRRDYEVAFEVESNESGQTDDNKTTDAWKENESEHLGECQVAHKHEGDDNQISFEGSERMSDASQSSIDFKEDFSFDEEEVGESSDVFQSCEFIGFEIGSRDVEMAHVTVTEATDSLHFNGVPENVVSSDNDSGDKQTESDETDTELAYDKSAGIKASVQMQEENYVFDIGKSAPGKRVVMESRIEASQLPNLFKGEEKRGGVYEQEWVTMINRKEGKMRGTDENEEKIAKESRQREVRAEKEQLERNDEIIKREREREKNRMVVERAIREARERAFAEARERAERAAVEKATAEARERVLAEARQKFEKTNTAAKSSTDKASLHAKLRSERAAVERAHAEARERALEKALSQKPNVPSSKLDGSNGESVERRNARLEKTQKTMERAAKALAEKNMRDLRAQREQAERHRLAETLDAEIKRWSSGKTGNLRALLSTLQYILGPDSGWQPVSLTEIVTTSAVKKAYRKATLHVHPDKLQQRGATIQQKYICEKVFDLLKAAWNRFNSEER